MSAPINLGALDRQLKKIYDCLNIGSNKKAVQEVDRLPKSVKDLTVFKALKSLALIRMQKILQATEIMDEINFDADLDEVTLQTMTSCCKESLSLNKIVEMYEAAARRNPNDLDIMSHLFMAYVRVYDYKRQKEIALQMYKNFAVKKRLHSFWAIMSLVMQSKVQSEASAKKVCLSLAEKMCEKMIDDERNQEEIELYLTILRKQNKHEEEYKFLTGPICSRLSDHLSWYKRRQAYLCLDLKMYSRAFKHYFPTLIQEYPDQIEYYQGLFKSAFILDTEAPSQQQPVALTEQQSPQAQSTTSTPVKFTSALAECFDIVEKQCQLCLESQEPNVKDSQQTKGARGQSKNLSRTSSLNPSRRRLLRGPFIARVELYDMILTNENVLPKNVYNLCKGQFTNKYPKLVSLLVEYIELFGKKIICHYDLDYMLNRLNLTIEDKNELVDTVAKWIQISAKVPASDSKPHDSFHNLLNYHMLRHALHDYKTSDSVLDRLKLAKEYLDIYDNQRELSRHSNVKTEFLPVDHYCLLAINSIMTNAMDLKMFYATTQQPILTDIVLISCIIMAQNAVNNSPSNHQLKLTLLKLYSLIGASKQCSDVLVSLDIKHFQIDTLGHLLNPILYNTGNFILSKESLSTCFGFYAHGLRECLECLTTSYREGRFSKIEEISNVLRRLYDSLNMAQCFFIKGAVDNTMATTLEELTWACRSFDPFGSLHRLFGDTESLCAIRDSRDFKVLKSLHFETNNLIKQRHEETLEDEKLWLKLRFCLLQSAFNQFEKFVLDKSDGGGKKLPRLEHGLKEVDSLIPKILDIRQNYQDDRYSYLEPEASPFKWKSLKLESLVHLVKPLLFCVNPLTLTQKDLEDFTSNMEDIIGNVEHQLSSINSLISLKRALATLTITIEFLSLCVTSLLSLNHIDSTNSSSSSTNNTSSVQNSSAAAKSAPTSHHQPATKTKSALSQIMNKTEAQLTKLSNLIKGLDPKATILDKISHLEANLLSDSVHTNIETKDKSVLIPLMGPEAQCTMLAIVKDRLLDSYSESLKEIENTCRRKVKLLRSKT